MHLIKDIRKKIDFYKKKLLERNVDLNFENLISLDKANRETIQKKESLEQEKKKLSKTKDKLNFEKSKKLSVEINVLTEKNDLTHEKIKKILSNIPNIALDDVPIGKDEKSNKIIKKVGEIKKFSFKVKSHSELGYKDIDFESSIKLSGSRFVVLKNKYALLERALINFMLDVHTTKFNYTEISPPLIVNDNFFFSCSKDSFF